MMRGRLMVGRMAVAVALMAAAAPAAAARAGAASPARADCAPGPFTAGFADFMAQRWPGHRFSASVDDSRTGCSWAFHPELRMTTASVVKAEIMAGVLLRAQSAGRGLTQWESDRIWPMITQSDNAAASELWSSLGGIGGMQAVDRAFGLFETTQVSPWGLTSTSAADRNRLLRQMLLGQWGPLSAPYRAMARSFMLGVVPSQHWGISAGMPPGWPVPLKNGFADSIPFRWRINSSGTVERPDGSALVVTIMSDGWPDQPTGIEAIETISRVIGSSVASDFVPYASPVAFVERQYHDLLTHTPSFAETFLITQAVGFSTDRAADVIANMLTSPEHAALEDVILRLYLGGLARLPDDATLRWRLWLVRTGQLSLGVLADLIAGSLHLSPGPFVDAISQRVLGRLPSPSDRQTWVDRLDAGLSRGSLLMFFTESAEARYFHHDQVLVADTYLALLARPPGSAAAYWQDQLGHGTPLTTLVGAIYASAEYRFIHALPPKRLPATAPASARGGGL